MKQTVVTRLIKAIEIAYKEHLPEWEFPNKEIWIQEEKEQIVDAWCNGYDEDDRATSSPLNYYNEIFNTNEK
jgi:hypothetical protein